MKIRSVATGTWYLSHSPIHNDRTVTILMVGCIAHARNGHIFTSAVKSDCHHRVPRTPISTNTRKIRQFGHK